MTNPLVAQREDSTEAFTGVPILEAVDETKKAIESGDWAAGVLGAVGTGLEMLGMALDPFGAILAAGVGWLIEHVGPLSDALDALTGDPDQIKAHSKTWKNIATELGDISAEMTRLVQADTASWLGEAGDSYRARSKNTATLITAAKNAADGASSGIGTAGEVVAAVRTLVRDIIAELVGHLISWALQVLATLGVAMAWVLPQVIAEVAKVASRIADITMKLVKAMKALSPMLKKLGDNFSEASKALKKVKADNDKTSPPAGGGKGLDRPPPGKSDGPASTKSSNADSPPPKGGNGDPPSPRDKSGGDSSPTPQPSPPPGNRGGGPRGGHNTKSQSVKNNINNKKNDSREPSCVPGSGDPVDLVTGQMFMTQVDVELPGMLPLIIERTHFSSYRAGRQFGPSWSSTLDQRLEVEDDGVYFAGEGGVRIAYPPPPADGGPVFAVDGPRWPLSRASEGGYQVEQPESGRTLEFFLGEGTTRPLTAVVNMCGHRIDIDRDATLVPIEVRHSGGYRIVIDTDNGLVTRLAMANPGVEDLTLVRYRYDGSGRLVEVLNSSNRPMLFDYDPEGRIVRWQDRNGEWYRYEYDGRGRVVRTDGSGGALTGSWEYDTENRVTRYTDSLGHTTSYHLNERGQIVRMMDPLGNATVQEWDRFDRRTSHTDPLGRTTRYEYDGDDLVAITRPDGSRTLAEYGRDGLPVTVVEPDGAIWRYTYDEQGNPLTVTDPAEATTRHTYDDRGNLTTTTDAAGNVHRVRSNAAGLPIATVDPSGATSLFHRDRFGRVTEVIDPDGHMNRLAWTIEGNELAHTTPDGAGERWRYDPEGNQVELVDEIGGISSTEITHFDLPLAETGPDGTRVQFGYDTELRMVSLTNECGLVWRYEYDAAGNMTSETDFNGRTIRYRYDAAGQVVEQSNGLGESTHFVWDLLGNVVESRCGDTVSTFEYDPNGRLVRTRNADAEVVYELDVMGRALRETVNGATTHYRYDVLGRAVYRRTPSGAESWWGYGADGRPRILDTAGRTIRFVHDAAGRETERALDSGTVLVQSWDGNDRLTGQVMSTTAGGADRSRVIQRRAYNYRPDGTPESVDDALRGPRQVATDRRGRVTAVRGSGWKEQYAYDVAGNLIDATAPGDPDEQGQRVVTGTLVRYAGRMRYEHDAHGRVVLRQRNRLSGRRETWRYEWNGEDRLTGVVTPDGSRWRYRYDPLGRRIAKERFGEDGEVVEWVRFHWDGVLLAEQVHDDAAVLTWNWKPDSYRVISQTERVLLRDAGQGWVDTRFFSITTDLAGMPTELTAPDGTLAGQGEITTWGRAWSKTTASAWTPLRYPGQYFDAETELHYNYTRYYDPASATYHSADPMGLDGGPNPHGYVSNPWVWIDPLGLAKTKCEAKSGKVTTLSGWSNRFNRKFTRVDTGRVFKLQQEMGHKTKTHNAYDQGVPGRYHACHAERQAALANPNKRIHINLPQCADCEFFFNKLAQHRQHTQVVHGPDVTRIFKPDGRVIHRPPT